MKTIIYYFTGTGNSLAAAKKIAQALGDCELVSIASQKSDLRDIVPHAERVGIIAPVYDFGLPSIVAEFAGRLDLSKTSYSFCVLTMGGIGASALRQMNDIVTKKNGRPLDAAWVVKMVGNFVPLYAPKEGKTRDDLLAAADAQVTAIAGMIKDGRTVRPGISPLSSLLKMVMYNGFIWQVHTSDKEFVADGNCTHCGTCSRVCPVKNIVMVNEMPEWQHRCELCMACLNLCPAQAIQWGQKTKTRGRYRHPDITIHDMKVQRGEPEHPGHHGP
ncbi:MAG: 4Fe-4S ferredoxin [Methanomicrobiales archaeon]|nr:4Fe-4S ferredoxin [Methanomicrobiales archaeon]